MLRDKTNGNRTEQESRVLEEIVYDRDDNVYRFAEAPPGKLDAGGDTAFLALSTLEQDPARRRAIQLEAIRALAPATRPAPTRPR